eukprot:5566255-Pyramimonas_sp.AAC.1
MARIDPLHKAEASGASIALVQANKVKAEDKTSATKADADAQGQAAKPSGASASFTPGDFPSLARPRPQAEE